MNLLKTSCCAIQDINGLQFHPSAEDAMIAFCQQTLLKPPVFGKSVGRPNEISSFFLFTAAVKPSYKPYGRDFKAFIETNKLGEVFESPLRPNRAWHPEHYNQVYVWMPDHTALKAWWAVNDPSVKVVSLNVSVPVPETSTPMIVAIKTQRNRKVKAEPSDKQYYEPYAPFPEESA